MQLQLVEEVPEILPQKEVQLRLVGKPSILSVLLPEQAKGDSFALQEIEKTARGLELTSIEAVGVLEMVKQSFIEEMFYDDFVSEGDEDGTEGEESGEKDFS